MTCGIYKFTNKTNGKIYIGQSINIERRYYEHFKRDDSKNYFHRAIKKYGKDNFFFEILEECLEEDLNDREKYYITIYNSNNRKLGYNSTGGGDGAESKKIKQYDENGKLIKIFSSITEAAEILNLPASNICATANKKKEKLWGISIPI